MNFSRRLSRILLKMPGISKRGQRVRGFSFTTNENWICGSNILRKGNLVQSKLPGCVISFSKWYSAPNTQNNFNKVQGIAVETKGNVRTIWLDNPRSKNVLNKEMFEGLSNIITKTGQDEDILICVLRAKGEFFSAGINLKTVHSESFDALKSYINALINFPKLLIAAVNGPAVGISVTMLGLFDIVYAKETASFVTPFSIIGCGPEGCSSYTFPQLMGKKKAMELLLLGKKIDAFKALYYNLVTEVLKSEDFDTDVENRISEISKLPKLSILFCKQLIQQTDKSNLQKINEEEMEKVQLAFESVYTQTFLKQFSEKDG